MLQKSTESVAGSAMPCLLLLRGITSAVFPLPTTYKLSKLGVLMVTAAAPDNTGVAKVRVRWA